MPGTTSGLQTGRPQWKLGISPLMSHRPNHASFTPSQSETTMHRHFYDELSFGPRTWSLDRNNTMTNTRCDEFIYDDLCATMGSRTIKTPRHFVYHMVWSAVVGSGNSNPRLDAWSAFDFGGDESLYTHRSLPCVTPVCKRLGSCFDDRRKSHISDTRMFVRPKRAAGR